MLVVPADRERLGNVIGDRKRFDPAVQGRRRGYHAGARKRTSDCGRRSCAGVSTTVTELSSVDFDQSV